EGACGAAQEVEGAQAALYEGAAREVHPAGVDRFDRGGDRRRLEARPRPFQELDLLGRAGTTEDRVAVRKAPEAPDDVAVGKRVAIRLESRLDEVERPGELAREILVRELLGMLERQIEEEPLHRRPVPVEAPLEGVGRHLG